MKKFELGESQLVNGKKVFPITALIDIPYFNVKKGEKGGYIESENILSHQGNAWVRGNATVTGMSIVEGDVLIDGNARVEHSELSGQMVITSEAKLKHCYLTGKDIIIGGKADMLDVQFEGHKVLITHDAKLYGVESNGLLLKNFRMTDNAKVENYLKMTLAGERIHFTDDAVIKNVNSIIGNNIFIKNHAILSEACIIVGNDVTIQDYAMVTNGVTLSGNVQVSECVKLYCKSWHLDEIQDATFSGDLEIDASRI